MYNKILLVVVTSCTLLIDSLIVSMLLLCVCLRVVCVVFYVGCFLRKCERLTKCVICARSSWVLLEPYSQLNQLLVTGMIRYLLMLIFVEMLENGG